MKNGKCGVTFNPATKEYVFYMNGIFYDFKNAVNHYVSGLIGGYERIDKIENALSGKPIFV